MAGAATVDRTKLELQALRPDVTLCLTEMTEQGCLDRLRANVAVARGSEEDSRGPLLTTAAYDWRGPPPPEAALCDMVLGSDLVYSDETAYLAGSRKCPPP